MPDEAPGPDSDPQGRLADVNARVRQALDRRAEAERLEAERRRQADTARTSSTAWRIMIDLVVATGLVGAIGFGLDLLTGFTPLGLIAGLFGGLALGMWLAVRRAARIQAAASAAGAETSRREDRS